jgi:hypothetical protein
MAETLPHYPSEIMTWLEAGDMEPDEFVGILDRRLPQLGVLAVNHSPFPGESDSGAPPEIREKWGDLKVAIRFAFEGQVQVPLVLPDVLLAFRKAQYLSIASKTEVVEWYINRYSKSFALLLANGKRDKPTDFERRLGINSQILRFPLATAQVQKR